MRIGEDERVAVEAELVEERRDVPDLEPTQLETGASDASVTPIVWTTTAKRSAATPSAASAGRSELPTMSTDE